jgi:Tol biopolymer transport system component
MLAATFVSFGVGAAGSAAARTPGANGPIAYTTYDPGTGDPHTAVVNPDGSGDTLLPIGVPNGHPEWSPDGSRLLMFTFTDAGFRPGISNPDGSGLTILTIPGLPAFLDVGPCIWDVSGTRILCSVRNFTTGDPSYDGIYSVAADGTDPVRLTVDPYPPSGEFGGGDIVGDVSPDGTRFTFVRTRQEQPVARRHEQSGALFVENLDGTGLRRLTPYGLPNSHDETAVSWSPDGSRILFGSELGSLFTIRPSGTNLTNLPIRGAASVYFAREPGWSPDGTRIVLWLYLGTVGQPDLYTISAGGRDLQRVTTSGEVEFPSWGPAA